MKNIIVFVLLIITRAIALSDEELKAVLVKQVLSCMTEHPVEMADLLQLQKKQLPKKPEVHCLLACAYRKIGLLNEKGIYDVEQAYKVAELAKNGDEQRFENAKKFADVCVTVNSVEVSDGEKGCERSALLFQCGVDNFEKFGFKV